MSNPARNLRQDKSKRGDPGPELHGRSLLLLSALNVEGPASWKITQKSTKVTVKCVRDATGPRVKSSRVTWLELFVQEITEDNSAVLRKA